MAELPAQACSGIIDTVGKYIIVPEPSAINYYYYSKGKLECQKLDQ